MVIGELKSLRGCAQLEDALAIGMVICAYFNLQRAL
jgi:hypothetical protein